MRPVRLRQAWRFWPKGHLFLEMSAAQAELMVRAGQAEYADTPKDRGTAAPASSPSAPRSRKRIGAQAGLELVTGAGKATGGKQ